VLDSEVSNLSLAFALADVADLETLKLWSPIGVASKTKPDGTPVTSADVDAELSMLNLLAQVSKDDGLLGEEIGSRPSRNGRRWIIDGIDGTSGYIAGLTTWGSLIALEIESEINLGIVTSPAQNKRWWAYKGKGAFIGTCTSKAKGRSIRVSSNEHLSSSRAATLPAIEKLSDNAQRAVVKVVPDRPLSDEWGWSQQMKVAEGELDACIWYCGDVWDHAAPSLIVEEAGGRFSDHKGGKRLDSRKALYSNGFVHDQILASLTKFET